MARFIPWGKWKKEDTARRGLFIHIPKTAGTSVRKELERKVNVVIDYPKHQSSIVSDTIYTKQDFYRLHQYLESTSSWLVGHIKLNKYSRLYSPRSVCTFVRDPIEQVLSHYNHFVKYANYSRGVECFIHEKRFCNVQSTYLSNVPLALLGCLGIQDEYQSSLTLVNAHFNVSLRNTLKNVNHDKSTNVTKLDDSVIEQILNNNSDDVKLYQRAKALFHARYQHFKQNQHEWVHGYYSIEGNHLSGLAYYEHSNDAVKLGVVVNGNNVAHITAQTYVELNHGFLLPRNSYVGFSIDLAQFGIITDLRLYVHDSRQKLERL